VIIMKKLLISLIITYQKIPGSFHGMCRHVPTCSNYAKEAIEKYGSIKGSYLTIKRILKCNPFHKGGIDLVPSRNNSCKIK